VRDNGGEEEDLDQSSWTGWWRTDTGNSGKRHNIEKSGVVGPARRHMTWRRRSLWKAVYFQLLLPFLF